MSTAEERARIAAEKIAVSPESDTRGGWSINEIAAIILATCFPPVRLFEAKLLGFVGEDRLKLCEPCLRRAMAEDFVIHSCALPLPETDFCYAEGDEGARFCGDPKSRHCSVLGNAEFWGSPNGRQHLVKCMKDDHLIHHAFIETAPQEQQAVRLETTAAQRMKDAMVAKVRDRITVLERRSPRSMLNNGLQLKLDEAAVILAELEKVETGDQ